MSIYQLAVLLIFVWITAGCQQTYQNTSSNSYTIEPVTSVDTTQKNNEPEETGLLHEVQTADETPISESKDVSENREESSENSDIKSSDIKPDDTAQEKIDQALELCNYAQQMWEKGKLQEALNNLDSAYYSILEIDSEIFPDFNQQKEDLRFLISKRILEIYASRQIVANGHHNEIPVILNKYVKNEIQRLTGPERKSFVQSLERSQKYRPFIVAELKKAGLPEEISWLPLIESGFKIRALSRARALGLWQFIPSTGYKFGLSRNYYIDERLDPEKATRAAIAYLKELHKLFGDWTTALAAYNCGEYRVLKIIRRQKINYLDNFWDLFQSLPRETSRYVPRFLATLHIINNLEKYNIKTDHSLSPIKYQTCEIKKQVRLKDIAKEINVSAKILEDLNPELRYALLPAETYQLKIPEEKAQLFLAKIDKIKTTYSPPPMYVYHRVKRGDTLSGIARKYGSSIRAISNANHINRRHTIIAGKILKIPSWNSNINKRRVATHRIEPGKTVKYKVRRGDSLWNIARKYGTTTKNIMNTNKLNTTTLSIGQRLYITSSEQVKIAKNGGSTYRVRSGDSPFLIAKRHNMNLNRFLALNHLSKQSTIFPGQELIVE